MKKIPVFVFIILLLKLSYGVVITGSVVNSNTLLPIDSVSIIFRIGSDPLVYPKAYSNVNGCFLIELTVSKEYLLQAVIEKKGYVFQKSEIQIISDSIDLGVINLDELKQAEITFRGIVVDSVTRVPVSGAKIVLTRANSGLIPYMDLYTDQTGSFSQLVLVSNDSKLIYTVIKNDYFKTSSGITIAMDSLEQTILIRPIGSIRLEVTGKVVDSITRQPVGNALVIARTNYFEAERADTSYTNSDGTFFRSVEAGMTTAAVPRVEVWVSHDGYTTRHIFKHLFSQSIQMVDFGEIAVIDSLTTGQVHANSLRKKHVSIYPLQYAVFDLNGRAVPMKIKQRRQFTTSSQIVISVEETERAIRTRKAQLHNAVQE